MAAVPGDGAAAADSVRAAALALAEGGVDLRAPANGAGRAPMLNPVLARPVSVMSAVCLHSNNPSKAAGNADVGGGDGVGLAAVAEEAATASPQRRSLTDRRLFSPVQAARS